MSYQAGYRKDLLQIGFLIAIALLIYYPVFYEEYAYTDELVGLWQWNTGKEHSANTLLLYGRFITAKLADWLFGSVPDIKGLSFIRIFSLVGWIACIPVWYFIFKKILRKENLPPVLCFFSILYLVCMPSFTVSIGWAACFEMFIANTAGLLSGYFLYAGIKCNEDRIHVSPLYSAISLIAGLVSLFTYQNCFGFFLLPFLLHFIANKEITKTVGIAIIAYFVIYIIYYLLFRVTLSVYHFDTNARTGLHINVGNKLPYFLARPLSSAFHFTYLFNEKSISGFVVYILLAGTWLMLSWYQQKNNSVGEKLKYFIILFCLLGLIFLPSLVVKENYASNRTLFAIRLAVFFLFFQTLTVALNTDRSKTIFVTSLSLLFSLNAWYNFNYQFLKPVKQEYAQLKASIRSNYKAGVDTIYFVRPGEDFFELKFGITRSWDEFGVPSTFFEWTPEFLIRQIVYEKTGSRSEADKLVIKSWSGRDEFLKSQLRLTEHINVVSTEALMGNTSR